MKKAVAPKTAKCTLCGQVFDMTLDDDRQALYQHFSGPYGTSCSPAEG